MTDCSGKIFARRVGEEICFLVIGRVDAHLCPAMRQYAEDALASGAKAVYVDLRDCTHCDSTFVGTLLRLRQVCGGRAAVELRLIRPSAAVQQILKQMGADRVFEMGEQKPAGGNDVTWQELEHDLGRAAVRHFRRNCAEAHQALAGEGGELAQRFGPLAEAMQQELAAEKAQPG
jgi:anti-anti-sigma factor